MGANDRVVTVTGHTRDHYVRFTFKAQLLVDNRTAIREIESSKFSIAENFDCTNSSKPRQIHSTNMLTAVTGQGRNCQLPSRSDRHVRTSD
jgi:hypothetical protein